MPIGFVTIGQSRRDEVVDSMLPFTLQGTVIQRGALDGLSPAQITNLAPESCETPYVTRLVDGSEVLISKAALAPYLQRAVDSAIDAGARAIVILCTGEFPYLEGQVPFIFPDRILKANVDALLLTGVIGVVMPHTDQMELMKGKWETPDRRMVGVAASPYSGKGELTRLASSLVNEGANLIVLDCMGFTSEMKQAIAAVVDVPVILANRLVGRIIEETMPDSELE